MANFKSMLSYDEMINNLKEKNIKFEKISEDEAKKFLMCNNNYYNITSYKNNFQRYCINKRFIDKYIDLDFAYLKDLSIIDYRLRNILFEMVIDIEHYLKLRILDLSTNIDNEDGYRIANLYLENDYKTEKRIHNNIKRKMGSVDYKKIFSKYDLDNDKRLDNIPLWKFLEVITFGELVDFYNYFIKEYDLKKEYKFIFILRDVVRLRNGVCHNSNLLSDLNANDNHFPPSTIIINFLKDCDINIKIRDKKLANSRIRQIVSALYMFNIIVTSDGIKDKIRKDINNLVYNRIKIHEEYYNNNRLLKSTYSFFLKIIEKEYKID